MRPQPRDPHLPDALRVLPGPAWLFVLLAAARLAWGLREASFGPTVDPWRVAEVVLFDLPSVVAVLLPAALLARHPDVASRGRALLFGVILLAAVEGLRVLGTPLQPFFEGLTPGDEAASFLVPAALIYQAATFLLGAFAVAGIGLGLDRARSYEDRSSSWPVSAILAALVVLIAVTGILSVSRLPYEQLPLTPTVVVYIVSTVVLNVLSAAAIAYLAATLTAGARAGEDPGLGWHLAAAGSWLVIGSLAALGLEGLVQATPESATFTNNIAQLTEGIFTVGYLGILGGFVLGLPSLDLIGDDDDAFGDMEAEEDDELDVDVEAGLATIEGDLA